MIVYGIGGIGINAVQGARSAGARYVIAVDPVAFKRETALTLGATHATELFAVFDLYRTRFGSLLTAAADGRSARRVSDDVQTRWREFSRTGVPGDDWPRYSRADRAVMVFDRRSRVVHDPHSERRTAWEGFTLATR